MKDINIPVTIGGVTFKNPFFVASGPTTKSVKQLLKIEETGWAAASIKLSIDPAPYINRKPRYGLFKEYDALAFTAEKRLTFEQGLKLIADAKPLLHDLKLMANITYAGDEGVSGWVNMAKKFEEVGADIIELNMCCPNMSYNMETTSGGDCSLKKQTGASMGQQGDVAAEIVKAIKENISIPLFVKLTPEGGQIAKIAKALYAAGADAVGGTGNRLGMPPINLDEPGKAFYHLQEEISMSCYCSKWLKPLAQRDTYEIRNVCGKDVSIMAAGGVTNWQDAVEMILCGGDLIGVCSETLISGYDICRPMIEGLDKYMKEHNYTELKQMRGAVVPHMKTALDVTLFDGYAQVKDPNLSAPCKSACPHHVPIQAYVQKIVKGEYREAFDLITEKNALQGLCALVCSSPCEDACVRGGIDSPVKIRELKKFILEYGKANNWKPKWTVAKSNGHKVAVIGSGACGLSAATELVKAGYAVTVFEKEEKIGGSMRYDIPDYTYDKAILDDEMATLEAVGVKFELGCEISDVNELKAQGFEKVIVANGKNECKEEYDIQDTKMFLNALNHGEKINACGSAVVIGNDLAAIDTARSLRRLGAEKITLLWTSKLSKKVFEVSTIDAAKAEGVVVLDNISNAKVNNGKVVFSREGIEMEIKCDAAYMSHDYLAKVISGDADFMIDAKAKTDNIISAISAGRNAAAELDAAICGEEAKITPIMPVNTVNVEMVKERNGYIKKNMNKLMLDEKGEDRVKSFKPYSRTMTEEEAKKEASRCLNCGCGEGCQLCKTICTDFAPEISDTDTMHIKREECVACGMCFNRCPNGNIEMVYADNH